MYMHHFCSQTDLQMIFFWLHFVLWCFLTCEISGSCSSEYDVDSLLGYSAIIRDDGGSTYVSLLK
jgi:hypothetical protein